jgi:hypothetical protein
MKSRIRNIAFWALLLSGAVILALLVSVPVQHRIRAQNQSVKPYTIQYHGAASNAKGDATQYDFLVAQRSSGDSMSQDSSPSSPRIVKLVSSGLLIGIAPSGNKIMTMGDGKHSVAQKFGDSCEGYTGHTGETQTILGFRTVKVVSYSDGNNSLTQTQESWLAPDLNCQHLQQKTTWTFNGQPDGVTTETGTWAIAGEPDQALFQVPENAVDVPPSVFYPEIGRPFEPKMENTYNKQKAARAALSLP